MTKLQSKHRFYKSDIKSAIDHSNQTTRLPHSPGPNSRQKLQTAIVVLYFRKYIHYNTPTRAITNL